MNALPDPVITALCDGTDHLIRADEPLAGLQLRCGGDLPGLLAVPGLLALVRKARCGGVTLIETVRAEDEGQPIHFVAEVSPNGAGTRLTLAQWRLVEGPAGAIPRESLAALVHRTAALHALLDAEGRVLAVERTVDDPDLAGDAAALAALAEQWCVGQSHWTAAVELVGVAHHQPLHWRLLDDVGLRIAGSDRTWRARIAPRGSAGFDLHILAEGLEAAGGPALPRPDPATDPGWSRLIGRDLVPALRQPINRIVANAETIRSRLAGPLSDDYAAYAANIAEAGRHLAALVEDLADLDAVEAPDFAPAPDRIDLADCGRRAAGILAMRAAERAITLVTPPEGLAVPATGEFRRVLQILLNLVTNAIRYGPAESEVTIAAGRDGPMAWIAVEDGGEGLDPEAANRIFAKFERLGRSGDGGSGLGLYISRRLARAMGGDLVVAVRDAPGTRFVLTLPGRDTA